MTDNHRDLNTEQARRLYLLERVHAMWPNLSADHAVEIARWLMTGTAPTGSS